MKNKIALVLFAAALALVIAGCASTPKIKPVPWKLSITERTPASIEMDVIGVTPSDQKYYECISWEDYWKPDSQIRRDAPKLTKFLSKDTPTWMVSPEAADASAMWKQWTKRGAIELLLVARLPETGGQWKVPLSLDKKAWKARNQTIEVEVLDSLVRVITPPRD